MAIENGSIIIWTKKIILILLLQAVLLTVFGMIITFNQNIGLDALNKNYLWSSTSGSPKKTIVTIVSSSRSNFIERQLIRDTWGSITNQGGWSVRGPFFLLGQGSPTEDSMIKEKLRRENGTFGDLVMGNFTDTYINLTLKTTMGYEWLTKFHDQADLVLKADDDVFVNIFELFRNLNDIPQIENMSKFYCCHFKMSSVIRDGDKKLSVTMKEYGAEFYPPYCSGTVYVTTMRVVKKVASVFHHFKKPCFRMEDVFVTGFAAQRFNTWTRKQGDKTTEDITYTDVRDWYFAQVLFIGKMADLQKWYRTRNSTGGYDGNFLHRSFYVFDRQEVNVTRQFINLWEKVQQIEGIL